METFSEDVSKLCQSFSCFSDSLIQLEVCKSVHQEEINKHKALS